MREKLRQFMIGRYGTDGLNQFLSIASIVMLLISLITRVRLFTYVGMVLLILCYYRSLSRNISKRTEENYKFYTIKDRITDKANGLKDQWANRKLYHYYRCPQCRQKLRVPRGRGRIQISCPRCGTPFIKKSGVMFGCVIPNQAALSPEAQARYRTAYCGLCRRIGALHGLRGRLTLSYDLTFLNLLLSSLYEGETECVQGCGHCPIHPVRKIHWRSSGPTDYCADLSVALHYYNAQDKWNDDHSLLGLGFEKLLAAPTQDAAARWPRQCEAIRSCLDQLAEYEAAGSEDLDAVSGCFGQLMAELFDYKQDHWSPELRSIGFHLGKYLYLLDAYDDLERDQRKGAYNPLKTLSQQPGYEEEMREIFELLLARCAKSFERLPCVEDADLLRNILYSGVWLKYNCKNAKKEK